MLLEILDAVNKVDLAIEHHKIDVVKVLLAPEAATQVGFGVNCCLKLLALRA